MGKIVGISLAVFGLALTIALVNGAPRERGFVWESDFDKDFWNSAFSPYKSTSRRRTNGGSRNFWSSFWGDSRIEENNSPSNSPKIEPDSRSSISNAQTSKRVQPTSDVMRVSSSSSGQENENLPTASSGSKRRSWTNFDLDSFFRGEGWKEGSASKTAAGFNMLGSVAQGSSGVSGGWDIKEVNMGSSAQVDENEGRMSSAAHASRNSFTSGTGSRNSQSALSGQERPSFGGMTLDSSVFGFGNGGSSFRSSRFQLRRRKNKEE